MKIGGIRVAAIAATVFATLIFSTLIVSYSFPIISSAETAKIDTTEFLWTYRPIDLIAQAFVLFAAAACCVALLRVEHKNGSN